ncbi:nucleotidyltransferase domain-containing protein [Desulfofundulus sp.]|uniref:nucleotidyltransferase domain-containing protein n=1 Tax=Desulfofundulus sp. TaxID=2282750 RepID=UPI003C7647BD
MYKRFSLPEKERLWICRLAARLLAKRKEIIFAYAFGSFVEKAAFRDIDIGVYLKKETISREKVVEYEFSLGAELEREVHYPVDLKVLNYAPVTLCHSVTGGKVLFSHDDEVRYEWVEKTWDMYLDMQYFLRNSLRDLLSPGQPAPARGKKNPATS